MTENETHNSKLVGLLAEFDDPTSLVHACDQARQEGYQAMDAYSPYPVHGIDPAIGIKRTVLPFIVLAVALGGAALGLGLQFYTNGGTIFGVSTAESPLFPGYDFRISGKPLFSLPANIPVLFEIIVLSSAFATFFGMWILNRLPRLANPLHRIDRFKRATDDKFFLMIETRDEKFDREQTESELNTWGAVAIEECRQDLTDTQLPSFVKYAGVLLAVLLLLPPVMIFRAKGMTSREPRLHFMPDMDWQTKGKTQQMSPDLSNDPKGHPEYLFGDRRVMRPPVPGTIARGRLEEDVEFYHGIKKDWKGDASESGAEDVSKYVTRFPKQVEVDEEFVRRGQDRFNIYCSACHGYAGQGDGLVNQRAESLQASGSGGASWTSAKSLHEPDVKDPAKNPVGRIFDTITNGRTMMGPYGAQIPVRDRWAIVAYVKALQETGIGADSSADDGVDKGNDKEKGDE